MSDEMEKFEKLLKSQPLRQAPEEWRSDILAAAREAESLRRSSPTNGLFALTPRRGRSYRLISVVGRVVSRRQAIRHSTKSGVPAAALEDASDAEKLTFLHRLSSWLWPHPIAWGGLAVIWMLLFAVHFSIQDREPALAEKVVPQSADVVAQLQQQHRLLAELLGPNDSLEADRPKIFIPKPRSESMEIFSV